MRADHGTLYLWLGYNYYADRKDEEASKYLNLATEYYKANYPYQIAKQKIQEAGNL